jgi:Bifunctional DNA primase/polymerase, N-terminal/Primase C terminal 1 (PriCT-1)
MSFKDIALQTINKDVPVIRTRPKSKIALDEDWPALATKDPATVERWNAETPEANCAGVAKAEIGGMWFLEQDSPPKNVPNLTQRIESETGKKIPATYRVRSRAGRGHYYFKQTPASIALGNVAQGYVKHEDFSARISNQYVISAGSLHPQTGEPYQVIDDSPIVEAPDWLIEWIKSQRVEKKAVAPDDGGPIGQGKRNTTLTSIAGKLRNIGFDKEEIEAHLMKVNQERCTPSLPDEDIATIAASVSRYPVGKDDGITFGGVPGGLPTPTITEELPEIDTTELAPRPVFPHWVIEGTTIGEGFAKPILASSSKHAEFLFMPAVQLMVNYLSGRVRVKNQTVNLNMFLGLISPYGKFFKSTSCELAHEYFKQAGMSTTYTSSLGSADGKVVITGAGSPEGFGLLMANLNCKHAVLYNEELGKFVAKAGIESSAFSSDLLTFYGAGDFNNTVKSKRDSFAFEARSYCFSWLWCTTDRGFNRHWPKLAGISSGLEDRMFFVLGPEKPKENATYFDPPFAEGAVETRKVLDAAVEQGVFECEYLPAVQDALKDLDPRSQQLVMTLALYFAIDLRETEITNEAINRARALVDYRNAVIKYLEPIEAVNELGRLQKEIRRELRRNRGEMKYRDLCRKLSYSDYGSDLWSKAIIGLGKMGDVAEYHVSTPGAKRKTHMIRLVRQED